MKILFIHGLASSGAYKMADALRILLRPCEVIAPDVPFDPDEALVMLRETVRIERPDLVVGHSLGGFWASQLRGTPKLLVNPAFHASFLMCLMLGEVRYLSPRKDGATSFVIDESLCRRYEAMEAAQFDGLCDSERALTWAAFADRDEMTDCREEFRLHYCPVDSSSDSAPQPRYISYSGTHLPTYREIKESIVPYILSILHLC